MSCKPLKVSELLVAPARLVSLQRHWYASGPVPVDVVVTTPEEFAWRKDYVGTIEWPATREGKVLYDRT